FFFSSRRRHTRFSRDWSSDVCSSDLDKTLPVSRNKVIASITVLVMLIFTKYVYMVSLTNYYTFYTISHFGVTVQASQLLLFLFRSEERRVGKECRCLR